MDQKLMYQIALTQIPNIGVVQARLLLEKMKVEDIFKAPVSILEKIEGIGSIRAKCISKFKDFKRVEEEIQFIEKYHLKTFFYTDEDYPKRLRRCYDAPVLLYFKGDVDFNTSKIISIVGSRTCTDYGKEAVKKIIAEFKNDSVLIVSGLAHGIDTYAHKAALDHQLSTIAVLAHGLDRIYPSINKNLAKEMVLNGGLLTEYMSQTTPDRYNFPSRNRIVAGLADAVIVVETDIKGGSLVTAEIADSYSVDVYAIPGDISRNTSKGTNFLIKTNRAILLDDIKDLKFNLGWTNTKTQTVEKDIKKIIEKLGEKEKTIVTLLFESKVLSIDEIIHQSSLNLSEIAATMLSLEMMHLIEVLPGKQYKLLI
ncbi:MAG: DNA-protecting protein DprA [Chitinophagaceae bacterium]|nr:MAG: DNA-protecting protein DprA [Chitinophagaceae bacterium]